MKLSTPKRLLLIVICLLVLGAVIYRALNLQGWLEDNPAARLTLIVAGGMGGLMALIVLVYLISDWFRQKK